jgi:hypothetical protein
MEISDKIIIISIYKNEDKIDYNLKQDGSKLTTSDLANILNLFKNAYGESFLEEAFVQFDSIVE